MGKVSRRLSGRVGALSFAPPVTHVYNPLVYARRSHEAYLRKYGADRRRVLLVGMNPGPFGMAQTGVPFGDVAFVRDFLGILRGARHAHNVRARTGAGGTPITISSVSGNIRLTRS